MILALSVFAAMFINVFARAFQQRNVAHNNYIGVVPTSFVMAAIELFIYGSVVSELIVNGFTWQTLFLWAAMGSGGAAGCLSSMLVHNRIFR